MQSSANPLEPAPGACDISFREVIDEASVCFDFSSAQYVARFPTEFSAIVTGEIKHKSWDLEY